jgi:hypothetical protein
MRSVYPLTRRYPYHTLGKMADISDQSLLLSQHHNVRIIGENLSIPLLSKVFLCFTDMESQYDAKTF